MLHVTINDRAHEFPAGLTILAALRQLGIDVPTVCHDDRLEPSGACRLCSVEITGWNRYATACNTPLANGMVDPNSFAGCRRSAANVVAIAGCKLSRRSRPRISRETISQVSDAVRCLAI